MATNTLLTSAPTPRDERGRYLEKPANLPVLTSAKAREAAQKRWDKYRHASAKGIMKEAMAIDPTVQTPADAYALVVGKQYVALMDSDKPKMDDVYRLGQIIGALPTAHDKVQAETGTSPVVHTLDPDVMALLAQIAGAQSLDGSDKYNYRKHEVVDGAVTETVQASTDSDTGGESGEG